MVSQDKKSGKFPALKKLPRRMASLVMQNKAEALLIFLCALLLFPNLGDRTFGGDEPYGIEAAGNIMRTGLPEWRSSASLDYNRTFVYNSPPSEYIMAASMFVFGFGELAARLPMALFGLASAIAIYLFVRRVANRKLALVALILTVFSAMFYLHSREARYYPMALFFNIIFLYAFHEYFILKKDKKWLYYMSAAIAVMFYIHIETAFYASIALAAWLLIKRKSYNYREILKPAAAFILSLVPLGVLVTLSNTYNLTAAGAPPILQSGFFGIFIYYFFSGIFYFLLFFVPVVFLFLIPKATKNFDKSLMIFFALLVASNILVSSTISPFGAPATRKLFVSLFPIVALINAAVIYYLWSARPWRRTLAIIALCLLLFTNFLYLFPANFITGPLNSYKIETLPDSTKSTFIERVFQPRYYFANYLFEISHHYESSIEPTLHLLENGSAGNTVLYPTRNNIYTEYLDAKEMKIVYSINYSAGKSFDWIVWENWKGNVSSLGIDMSNYQAYSYTSPSYIDDFWGDMPDLVNHLFSSGSVSRLNMTIYKKSS